MQLTNLSRKTWGCGGEDFGLYYRLCLLFSQWTWGVQLQVGKGEQWNQHVISSHAKPMQIIYKFIWLSPFLHWKVPLKILLMERCFYAKVRAYRGLRDSQALHLKWVVKPQQRFCCVTLTKSKLGTRLTFILYTFSGRSRSSPTIPWESNQLTYVAKLLR